MTCKFIKIFNIITETESIININQIESFEYIEDVEYNGYHNIRHKCIVKMTSGEKFLIKPPIQIIKIFDENNIV